MVAMMDSRLEGRKFSRVLGKKYERWTVIEDLIYWETGKTRKVLCKCSCENGTEKLVGIAQLNDGTSRSCGCLLKEVTIKRNFKHGYSKRKERNPLYDLINNMISRCLNKNNKAYKNYGARGITICEEWLKDNVIFFDWCLENGWEDGLTIDRINNDGNYEPSNCRFVTKQENNENRRLIRVDNSSGFRGIYKRPYNYAAKVVRNGIVLFDKSGFKTPEQAAIARDIFCIKNNIPYALNFPELAFSWCI